MPDFTRSPVSRRQFLIAAAGASAAYALWPAVSKAADNVDPRIAELVKSTIGVDMHNHVDVPLQADQLPGPDIDLAGELKKSGLSVICMTFAVDYQALRNPGDAYNRFINGLTAMDAQLARNKMKRALNFKDLKDAHDQGQPIVVQSVEGGHFIEGKIERVEEAYQRGLRHLGLLHDHDATPPLGDVYTEAPRFGGLTELGASVIKECERLGIVVDLAHASKETTAAALKVATKPVLITHTGLDTQLGKNPRMAQMMRPRLISKEHAKIVAEAGGMVGVWTHLADTTAEFVTNVKALVDVIGVDHVGIGTDTKLTPPYGGFGGGGPGGRPGTRPSGGPDNGPPRGPNGGGGPGGPGGGPGRNRPGERTNQAWPDVTNGFYYAVVGEMLKQGFTPEDIGKIGGGNFCRVFDAATTGH